MCCIFTRINGVVLTRWDSLLVIQLFLCMLLNIYDMFCCSSMGNSNSFYVGAIFSLMHIKPFTYLILFIPPSPMHPATSMWENFHWLTWFHWLAAVWVYTALPNKGDQRDGMSWNPSVSVLWGLCLYALGNTWCSLNFVFLLCKQNTCAHGEQ